jgi:hypothetical protein
LTSEKTQGRSLPHLKRPPSRILLYGHHHARAGTQSHSGRRSRDLRGCIERVHRRADEQAFVESYAGKTFAEADPQLALARAICTDRCAAKALDYLSAPSAGISYTIDELKVDKSDPANANLALAKSLWTHAEEQLALLNPSTRLRPRSSTA